jgi:ABC-type transport system involved in multi-copper enzyme maturation permease subunit
MTAVMAIAYNTMREALSRRVVLLFLFGALVLIILSPLFSFLSPREELTLLKSLGLGVIQLASMFICIVMGISLIPTEIERRTIYTVLSKPVQRYEFCAGQVPGRHPHHAVQHLVYGHRLLRGSGMARYAQTGAGPLEGLRDDFLPDGHSGLAGDFLLGVPHPLRQLLHVAGGIHVGTLSSVTESLMKGENRTIIQKGIGAVLHYLLPQFGNFNVQNKIIHPETRIINETVYYIQNIGYALLYIAILLIIAVIIFDRREV